MKKCRYDMHFSDFLQEYLGHHAADAPAAVHFNRRDIGGQDTGMCLDAGELFAGKGGIGLL